MADLPGIRFVAARPEGMRATLLVRPDLCTLGAVVHGGALMAFADTLGAVATVLNLALGQTTATLESKTNFLRPAPASTTLTGECLPVHVGRRPLVWQTKISGADGKLLAVVTQTQLVLEPAGDLNSA